jgi:hypothetical protein
VLLFVVLLELLPLSTSVNRKRRVNKMAAMRFLVFLHWNCYFIFSTVFNMIAVFGTSAKDDCMSFFYSQSKARRSLFAVF